jgi:pyocin large subunit-like protein
MQQRTRRRAPRPVWLGLALVLLAATVVAWRGGAAPWSGPTQQAASSSVAARPSGPAQVDRERIAREATWAPGQLRAHVEKHGREGPWASEADFDASARETIRIGTAFTYLDRESNAERLGFYHRETNRFVGVSSDGRRITTQFKPDRGEAYVRGLDRSTYR